MLENVLSKEYVPRTIFEDAKKLAKDDLIKVITGPRRAGKSILSILLVKDAPFAF